MSDFQLNVDKFVRFLHCEKTSRVSALSRDEYSPAHREVRWRNVGTVCRLKVICVSWISFSRFHKIALLYALLFIVVNLWQLNVNGRKLNPLGNLVKDLEIIMYLGRRVESVFREVRSGGQELTDNKWEVLSCTGIIFGI